MNPIWSIEPILRRLRIMPIIPYVKPGGVMVDVGCDDPPLTINYFKHQMKMCIGLDAEVENKEYENVILKRTWLTKEIPLPDNTADTITMLAVLEHMDFPEDIAKELYRILKSGGTLLLTVPSPANKPILEILAKLHIVRPEMIAQHKNYFTHAALKKILSQAGFKNIFISSFQLGLNTVARAIK